MSWGGNQYTGGKNKFAKATSQRLKFAGKLFGGISIGLSIGITEYNYKMGYISNTERILDHVFTGISSIPVAGTIISLSYELGKEHGPSTWF